MLASPFPAGESKRRLTLEELAAPPVEPGRGRTKFTPERKAVVMFLRDRGMNWTALARKVGGAGQTECLRSRIRYRSLGSGPVGREKLPDSGQLDREPIFTHLGSGWQIAAILRQEYFRGPDGDQCGRNGQEHG